MVAYDIVFTKLALKHIKLLKQAGLKEKTCQVLELLKLNPRQTPPPYEKLMGDMYGFYSRRINYQHRLVYDVDDDAHTVKILSMWSHYEQL